MATETPRFDPVAYKETTTPQVGRKESTMKTTREMSKALFGGGLVFLLVLTLASHAVAQTCVQPPDSLVSWWPGDGNVNDIVGSNHGTLQGGATFATGKVG